jgi:hypothetical protein
MQIALSRHDLWSAVDALKDRVEQAGFSGEALAVALGGLTTLEMLLRPPTEPAADGEDASAALTELAAWTETPRELPVAARKAGIAEKAPVIVPATPKAAAAPDSGPLLTLERRELLQKIWGDPAHTLKTVTAAVNATEGKPIRADSMLYKLAEAAGLPRTRTGAGVDRFRMVTASATPPANPPAAPDDEDMREAEAMAKAGRSGREIAEYFGWKPERGADLVARVREQAGAEAAA